jgi:hypothetical protein
MVGGVERQVWYLPNRMRKALQGVIRFDLPENTIADAGTWAIPVCALLC